MAKRHIPPISSGRVRLRLLEEADLPTTLAWRNQDHIRRWFFRPEVITPGQHREWWERYRERDDDFVFVIEETETLKRPVGQVALYNIDWEAGRAEFGRLMIGDNEMRGKGVARLATEQLLCAALGAWGLAEVYLEVLSANTRAQRIYKVCGFTETSRREDSLVMTRRTPPDCGAGDEPKG